ncbi:hypothetical protein ABBQ32_004033 [Trebouxia sp. C0010 RCD-2024]
MESQLEAVRQDIRSVKGKIVDIEQDLAIAKQAKNEEQERKLFDMLLILNNQLSGLQEEKNILLRSQAPRASLIQAEDGPRLSAFLAEWDESRRKSSIRSAQLSNINTEIWNTVRQTARLTVASYEGSMSPTYAKKFPAYQWDDRYEGSQADRYMPYILQNIKVDSRQWQWVDVQGQRNLRHKCLCTPWGTTSKAQQT